MAYVGVKPAAITSATQAEIAGDLTVDTNTLKVDAANNRVGIGTTTPDSNLKIKSTGAATLRLDGGAVAASVGPLIVGEHNDADSFYIGTNSVVLGESSNQDVVIYGADSSSGNIRFYAGASTETARIRDGGGITFNGDTAAANALADYETGTWTPTLIATSSNPTIASVGNTTGYYAKIGDMVWFGYYSGALNITNAGSGAAQISGLPYNSMNSSFHYWVFDYKHGTAISNDSTGGFIILNSNTMQFVRKNDTNGANWVVGNPKYLMISGYYRTA